MNTNPLYCEPCKREYKSKPSLQRHKKSQKHIRNLGSPREDIKMETKRGVTMPATFVDVDLRYVQYHDLLILRTQIPIIVRKKYNMTNRPRITVLVDELTEFRTMWLADGEDLYNVEKPYSAPCGCRFVQLRSVKRHMKTKHYQAWLASRAEKTPE